MAAAVSIVVFKTGSVLSVMLKFLRNSNKKMPAGKHARACAERHLSQLEVLDLMH